MGTDLSRLIARLAKKKSGLGRRNGLLSPLPIEILPAPGPSIPRVPYTALKDRTPGTDLSALKAKKAPQENTPGPSIPARPARAPGTDLSALKARLAKKSEPGEESSASKQSIPAPGQSIPAPRENASAPSIPAQLAKSEPGEISPASRESISGQSTPPGTAPEPGALGPSIPAPEASIPGPRNELWSYQRGESTSLAFLTTMLGILSSSCISWASATDETGEVFSVLLIVASTVLSIYFAVKWRHCRHTIRTTEGHQKCIDQRGLGNPWTKELSKVRETVQIRSNPLLRSDRPEQISPRAQVKSE